MAYVVRGSTILSHRCILRTKGGNYGDAMGRIVHNSSDIGFDVTQNVVCCGLMFTRLNRDHPLRFLDTVRASLHNFRIVRHTRSSRYACLSYKIPRVKVDLAAKSMCDERRQIEQQEINIVLPTPRRRNCADSSSCSSEYCFSCEVAPALGS